MPKNDKFKWKMQWNTEEKRENNLREWKWDEERSKRDRDKVIEMEDREDPKCV